MHPVPQFTRHSTSNSALTFHLSCYWSIRRSFLPPSPPSWMPKPHFCTYYVHALLNCYISAVTRKSSHQTWLLLSCVSFKCRLYFPSVHLTFSLHSSLSSFLPVSRAASREVVSTQDIVLTIILRQTIESCPDFWGADSLEWIIHFLLLIVMVKSYPSPLTSVNVSPPTRKRITSSQLMIFSSEIIILLATRWQRGLGSRCVQRRVGLWSPTPICPAGPLFREQATRKQLKFRSNIWLHLVLNF